MYVLPGQARPGCVTGQAHTEGGVAQSHRCFVDIAWGFAVWVGVWVNNFFLKLNYQYHVQICGWCALQSACINSLIYGTAR